MNHSVKLRLLKMSSLLVTDRTVLHQQRLWKLVKQRQRQTLLTAAAPETSKQWRHQSIRNSVGVRDYETAAAQETLKQRRRQILRNSGGVGDYGKFADRRTVDVHKASAISLVPVPTASVEPFAG